MRVSFHRLARAELEEAAGFYHEISRSLADGLRNEVSAALDRIVDYPGIGFPVRAQLRRFVLRRFPYSLIYTVDAERIRILAVMHHRRRPADWKERMEDPDA